MDDGGDLLKDTYTATDLLKIQQQRMMKSPIKVEVLQIQPGRNSMDLDKSERSVQVSSRRTPMAMALQLWC